MSDSKFKSTQTKNNKVAPYIRANNVDGIPRQFVWAMRFAEKHNYNLSFARIYIDICSGNAKQRPGFDKMLAEAEAKKFSTIVVTRQDRLARTPEQLFVMLMQLVYKGLEVKAAS